MATDEALQLFCTTILYFWDKYVRTSKYFDKRRFDTKQYVVWATSPASSYDCAMAALKEANDMDSVFDYQQETAAQARYAPPALMHVHACVMNQSWDSVFDCQ